MTKYVISSITISTTTVGVTMTVAEMYQELQQQLLEERLLGVSDTNYYDDCCYSEVEIDYTTQS